MLFYLIYLIILVFCYVVFVSQFVIWASRWKEGSKRLKSMDKTSEKYSYVCQLRFDAMLYTISCALLSLISLYEFVDCLRNLIRRI